MSCAHTRTIRLTMISARMWRSHLSLVQVPAAKLEELLLVVETVSEETIILCYCSAADEFDNVLSERLGKCGFW